MADKPDREADRTVDPESLPQTEPTAAPIFDSGPFPEPLAAEADAELAESVDSGQLSAQPEPETWADADSGSWSQGDARAWSQAEADSDGVADLEADLADEFEPEGPDDALVAPATPDTDADADTGEIAAVPARSVVVPGQYSYLKWWKLVLVFAAVWLPAMAIGLGLYYWWVDLIDKTPAVFVTLVYVVACTVAGLILAMMSSKPLVAATALALTSAIAASVIGAAPLYGHYYCQVSEQLGGRCLLGILPY
ncbi:hypothetical protein [Mycolicibacillus trivialis]|uniref:Transmembrane protein n=1 Tax=Mycolicibacillus trivialis TaxID=1798 RepID=A0A1X2ENA6_9MYCO|nr:hypothetical protein [Mycolicibacillus trivialis]ORX07008.1 hypothetical protein AWC30_05455 [Mycolicibacillus trivialis]